MHVQTRGDLLPDPSHDTVYAVLFTLAEDGGDGGKLQAYIKGVILLKASDTGSAVGTDEASGVDYGLGEPGWMVSRFDTEEEVR